MGNDDDWFEYTGLAIEDERDGNEEGRSGCGEVRWQDIGLGCVIGTGLGIAWLVGIVLTHR